MKRNKILLACLTDMKINLVTSQPLVQGLASQIPLSKIAIPEVFNLSSRHLQLIRSIPAKCLLTSVVGMKHPEHVHSNLEVIKKPPMARQDFFQVIKPIRRVEFIEDGLDF